MNGSQLHRTFLRILSAASLVLLLSACGNSQDADADVAPTPTPSSAASTTPSPADPAARPGSPSAADIAAAESLAAELTQVVRKYAAEKQRAPKSFDEIVAAGYLPGKPVAPAGKQFAINKNLQVYLADQ